MASVTGVVVLSFVWAINGFIVGLFVAEHANSKRREKDADLEITDYVYSDGKWVRL